MGSNNIEHLTELVRTLVSKTSPIACTVTVSGKAQCHHTILQDSHVNLYALPALKSWPEDGGHAINMAVVQTLDPETGTRNLGIYRLQIHSRNTLGLHCHKGSGCYAHLQKAKKLCKPLEITAFIAPSPAILLSAAMPLPNNIDELELAVLISGHKIETTKAITVDHDIPVSSNITIEGYSFPDEKRLEGPFGIHSGYYTPAQYFPVFHVRCITMRRKPVFQATVTGPPPQEDCYIARLAFKTIAALELEKLDDIVSVDVLPEGVFFNMMFVSVRNGARAEMKDLANELWSIPLFERFKMIFLLDEDTSMSDRSDILWRMGNNLDPLSDIYIQKGKTGLTDPSSCFQGKGGKICFDCRSTSYRRLTYDKA
jgi:4-hydroxy-3-polyprenylbenzoate decarboxylase